MIQKPFADIGPDDVRALIDNQVGESRTLDYKQEGVGPKDDDRLEFLKDVSALANTGGGDILFGVSEKREGGKTTGLPEAAVGLTGYNHDAEVRRLDDVLRTGLKPRLAGVRYKELLCPGGPVLLVRLDRSFTGPHMVVARDHNRFWGRNAGSKYMLDVDELRRAFLLSADLPERVRRFRADRVELLRKGDTPLGAVKHPTVALHLIPATAFESNAAIDVVSVEGKLADFPPLRVGRSYDGRFNLDGFMSYSTGGEDRACRSYALMFRSGAVEAVDTFPGEELPGGSKVFPAPDVEWEVVLALGRYLRLLTDLGIAPPLFVLATALGVRGCYIPGERSRGREVLDRDTLLLPDVMIREATAGLPADLPGLLRPAFDAMWQAGGWRRSTSYDAAGNWNPVR